MPLPPTWRLASIRSAPPLGLHLLDLAHSGLENGAEGEWPQRECSAVELQVGYLAGWFPADVLRWLREAGGGGAPEHTLQPPADGQPGCALARFVGSIGLAAAQQPTPPADAQQQSQQEKAQQTPSGKMGAEEPSSHTPNAKPQENAVFVNGALAVPGAPANTDTVPAKFSKKNAADDELITVAYTFKTLTDDERRAIYQALKGQPYSAFNADVGTEVPPGIELRPVPNEVAARVPQTRDYRYTVANDRVLLVGTNRIVVGVFAAAPTHP